MVLNRIPECKRLLCLIKVACVAHAHLVCDHEAFVDDSQAVK